MGLGGSRPGIAMVMMKIMQKEKKNERFQVGDGRERWGTLRAELEKPQDLCQPEGAAWLWHSLVQSRGLMSDVWGIHVALGLSERPKHQTKISFITSSLPQLG